MHHLRQEKWFDNMISDTTKYLKNNTQRRTHYEYIKKA